MDTTLRYAAPHIHDTPHSTIHFISTLVICLIAEDAVAGGGSGGLGVASKGSVPINFDNQPVL